MKKSPAFLAFALCTAATVHAQTVPTAREVFLEKAMQLRQTALLEIEPQVTIPTTTRTLSVSGKYPWKTRIVTTVSSAERSTAWDPQWRGHFGGADSASPAARRNLRPAAFTPQQNPFYVALPYNDVARGTTKPEAKVVIPWFKVAFVKDGQSVCRDRWLAVRNSATDKICYAQWIDCGPFGSDHWQYVFGPERPKPNLNGGAGLNVSPAVRDYLGLGSTDVTDWKFVEARDVPDGLWAQCGENNDFVKMARRTGQPLVPLPALPQQSTLPLPPLPLAAPPASSEPSPLPFAAPLHDYLDPANNARPIHKAPAPPAPDAR